jgi:prepilin-type N-terminal cleavage/methylation domain-containing protein
MRRQERRSQGVIVRKSRRGFTLIEVLTVIGIILLLIGIAVVGFRYIDRSANMKHTRVVLENARAMMTELDVNGSTNLIEGAGTPNGNQNQAPFAVGAALDATTFADVNPGQTGRSNAYGNCQSVVIVLTRVPKNKQTLQQLPSKAVASDAQNVLLDGWGNPLIYVPSGGLKNVKIGIKSDGTGSQTVWIKVPPIPANGTDNIPHRGFWLSAGPDGDFTTGDDNVIANES